MGAGARRPMAVRRRPRSAGPKDEGGERRQEAATCRSATSAPRINPAPSADCAKPMLVGSSFSRPSASGAQIASRAKKAKFQKIAQRLMPRSSSWRTTKAAPALIEAAREGRRADDAVGARPAFGRASKHGSRAAAEGGQRIAPGRRQVLGESRAGGDGARRGQSGSGPGEFQSSAVARDRSAGSTEGRQQRHRRQHIDHRAGGTDERRPRPAPASASATAAASQPGKASRPPAEVSLIAAAVRRGWRSTGADRQEAATGSGTLGGDQQAVASRAGM